MTRERNLQDGEQQIIRRGARPAGGWHNRTVIWMSEEGEQWLVSALPRKHPGGGSGGGTTPPPIIPPDPPPDPEPDTGTVQGYARVWMLANGKSGGSLSVDDIHTPATDATVYTVSTWSALRAALLASGKRFIKVTGAAVMDGGGASVKITSGAFTVDFSFHTGQVKNYKLINVTVSDNIWTQGALRTGEGATPSASADRRCLTFNPSNDPGAVLHGIVMDHMSFAWGPDVVGSSLNSTEDATMQYCLVGPALYQSNIPEQGGAKGYGWNTTTPGNSDPNSNYTKRITVYRNLFIMNKQRNLKYEHTDGVDAVNNVVYDWGNQCPVHGNFRGGNIMSNIFKKGPESQASNDAFEEDTNYSQYSSSTYHNGNIGLTAAGSSFTLGWSDIDAGALRGTPYANGPTHATHGALTVDTADSDLFDAVVANAGRVPDDDVATLIKDHAVNGTSDGFYNGAGFAAPHPFWT